MRNDRSYRNKMASLSNDDVNKPRRSEVNCPICMCILVHPVTLPCRHALCMPCFKQHVAETSLFCPICRMRISVWARRASRQNKLVDEKRWEEIKTAFPDAVRRRLEGKDESSSEDDDDFEGDYYVPNIAEPGELRREYEEEQSKFAGEWFAKHREEEEASLELITQLQREEATQREQERQDLEIAARLSKEINGVTPQVVRSPSSSATTTSIPSTPKRPQTPQHRPILAGRSQPSATVTRPNDSPGQQQAHLKMWFQSKRRETAATDTGASTSNHGHTSPIVRTTFLTPGGVAERRAAIRRGEDPSSVTVMKGEQSRTNEESPLRHANSVHLGKRFESSSPNASRKRLCLQALNQQNQDR